MAFITSLWCALLGSLFVIVTAQDYSITDAGVIGTGCAPGTTTANIIGKCSADSGVSSYLSSRTAVAGGKDLSISYKSFVASDGPSASIDDNRKNCQATLTIKTPAGYQFGFDRFSHNASYSVGAGVKAEYSTLYYFQSKLPEAKGGDTIVGPAQADATLADVYSGVQWSACGGSNVVGVNTDIRVTASSGATAGVISIHSTPSIGRFIWRKC